MRKIAFTTSRDPAKKTRSFIKDIITVIPNAIKVSRGTQNLTYTLNVMKTKQVSTAIVINSVKGNPNFWRIFDLSKNDPIELSYAIKLKGLTLSREYTKKRALQPNFTIFISSLKDKEAESILKLIFNIREDVPLDKSKNQRYVTIYADYIDEDEKIIFIESLNSQNESVGPRMKLKIIKRRINND